MMPRLPQLRTPKGSALDELADLRQDVRDAEANAARIEGERDSTRRRLAAARNPLLEHHRDVGAGRIDPDPAIVAKLRAKVERDEAKHQLAADTLTAQHAGALELVEERRQAVPRYIAGNRSRLERELSAHALATHERLVAARDELYAAAGEWNRVASEFRNYAEQWGESPADVPLNPVSAALDELERTFAPLYSGQRRDPRRLYPMPASLAPGDDDQTDQTYADEATSEGHRLSAQVLA